MKFEHFQALTEYEKAVILLLEAILKELRTGLED